jgi:hypothetical protein
MKYALFATLFFTFSALAQICRTNKDCADILFCNGEELCMPQSRNANSKGCIQAIKRPCTGSNVCDESANMCRPAGPTPIDNDGDGVDSVASGGSDCDDSDATRYPGRYETCDSKDDDCDDTTFGNKDSDGDGYIDVKCTNPSGRDQKGGNDCDDNNAQIRPGAQICSGNYSVNICDYGGLFVPAPCGSNLKCYSQPNGLGICAP